MISTTDVPPKKKRGRPPKPKVEMPPQPPKKRGRPPKAIVEDVKEETKEVKRVSRPKKLKNTNFYGNIFEVCEVHTGDLHTKHYIYRSEANRFHSFCAIKARTLLKSRYYKYCCW